MKDEAQILLGLLINYNKKATKSPIGMDFYALPRIRIRRSITHREHTETQSRDTQKYILKEPRSPKLISSMIQPLPIYKLLRSEPVVGKGRPQNQNIQTLYFCEVCGTWILDLFKCVDYAVRHTVETKHILNLYFFVNVDLTFLNENRFQKTFNYQIEIQ